MNSTLARISSIAGLIAEHCEKEPIDKDILKQLVAALEYNVELLIGEEDGVTEEI